ncbi:hypothetical protein [Dactylosporangium salmoneum]|uniref:hypothetical protein n=1 Tax=Dactylosporangium salmoneum TaxID=53361 RepID=UPI0031DBFA82
MLAWFGVGLLLILLVAALDLVWPLWLAVLVRRSTTPSSASAPRRSGHAGR